MSEAKENYVPWNKNIPCTEETKRKISKANKGLQAGENHFNYGKHLSEETRQKMSEAHKGCISGMKGKHHSEEARQKMHKAKEGKYEGENNPRSRPVILIHPNGKEEQFNCIKIAEKKYNLTQSKLSAVAKGKRNHHKGYKCRYV
jgi:hypothetical protein